MSTPVHKDFMMTSLIAILIAHMITGCSGVGQLDTGGGDARSSDGSFDPGGKGATPFDFQKECGINTKDMDDPNKTIFKQSMASMPIITQGTSMGTNFRVIALAKIDVTSMGGGKPSAQNISVEIVSTEASSGGGIVGMIAPGIVKSKANDTAKAQSGEKSSKSIPNGEWIKLTSGSNPEYKDLLCAITGSVSTESRMNNGDSSTITYSPALVNTVSPYVSKERAQKEIGGGRTLSVTATVTGKANNAVPGTYNGKVIIKMVNPSFKVQDKTITGDFAVEFVNSFPGGAYKAGLPSRIVYVVSSKHKKFMMLLVQSDFKDPTTGASPDIYMIGQ
jgi:hypothetical protein